VEGKEASPGACSTWASAGLGVDLDVDPGAEGGWGLWWCIWWGVGGRGGGQGSDVVVEFLSAAPRPDDIQEAPPHATKSKIHADSDCFACEPKPALVGKTKIGSQITACGNSELRRRSRD
jgi:hypothetical protein